LPYSLRARSPADLPTAAECRSYCAAEGAAVFAHCVASLRILL